MTSQSPLLSNPNKTTTQNIYKRLSLQLILFILFTGILTLFVNSHQSYFYHPWHLSIESIVERGNINVDSSSTPEMKDVFDIFHYKGKMYINKQPGIAFIGAVFYFFLYKCGLSYKENFLIVTGMITILTSVLMTAAMMIMFFNIVFKIIKNVEYSFIASCFFGFGTLIFPYSGLPHHDIFGTFFLFLGFYLLFYNNYIHKKNASILVLLAGLSTGFSLFNSYNTIALIISITLYVFLKQKPKDIILFLLGLIIGLSPSFIFNYLVFGHPLNFSTLVSKNTPQSISVVPFYFSIKNILQKLDLYLLSPYTSITFYSPIFILALFGFILLPKKYTVEKFILPLSFVLQFFQLTTIGATGWCQYGPRYLMETMPFMLLGVSGFFIRNKNYKNIYFTKYRYLIMSLVFITGIVSIIICTVGSITTTSYCRYDNAFLYQLREIILGKLPVFRFLTLGLLFIFISIGFLLLKYYSRLRIIVHNLSTSES